MTGFLALLGSLLGSAFALVRFALGQARAMTDGFVAFLERAMKRQEEGNARFSTALDALTESVRENSLLLRQALEKAGR